MDKNKELEAELSFLKAEFNDHLEHEKREKHYQYRKKDEREEENRKVLQSAKTAFFVFGTLFFVLISAKSIVEFLLRTIE